MVAALLSLIIQAPSDQMTSISNIVDESLKKSHWSKETAKSSSSTTGKWATYDYKGNLLASAKVELHKQSEFWESGDPRKNIALASETVLSHKGGNWSIYVLDFTNSQRRADTHKPSMTNLSIIFHHGLIGGSVRLKSLRDRGFVSSDQVFAKDTLKELAANLKRQFERS